MAASNKMCLERKRLTVHFVRALVPQDTTLSDRMSGSSVGTLAGLFVKDRRVNGMAVCFAPNGSAQFACRNSDVLSYDAIHPL